MAMDGTEGYFTGVKLSERFLTQSKGRGSQ